VKIRRIDPIDIFDSDDLALETFSDIGRSVPGWSRDETKQTDYICWYFETTGRTVLMPFPMLCAVFMEKWQEWRETYRPRIQNSGRWRSECIFVPRSVIWEAITQNSILVTDYLNKKKFN
jgi:hypothetical protein